MLNVDGWMLSRLTYTFVATTNSVVLARTILLLLESNESFTCSGVALELASLGAHGKKRVWMLSLKVLY